MIWPSARLTESRSELPFLCSPSWHSADRADYSRGDGAVSDFLKIRHARGSRWEMQRYCEHNCVMGVLTEVGPQLRTRHLVAAWRGVASSPREQRSRILTPRVYRTCARTRMASWMVDWDGRAGREQVERRRSRDLSGHVRAVVRPGSGRATIGAATRARQSAAVDVYASPLP